MGAAAGWSPQPSSASQVNSLTEPELTIHGHTCEEEQETALPAAGMRLRASVVATHLV